MAEKVKKKMKYKTKLIIFKYLFGALAYIGLFTPLLCHVIINKELYFVRKEGLTISLGGIMLVLFIFMLVKIGFKKLHKAIWVSFLLLILYALDPVIKNSLIICFYSAIGVYIYSIFEIPFHYFTNRLLTYTGEEIRQVAREETKTNINGSV